MQHGRETGERRAQHPISFPLSLFLILRKLRHWILSGNSFVRGTDLSQGLSRAAVLAVSGHEERGPGRDPTKTVPRSKGFLQVRGVGFGEAD